MSSRHSRQGQGRRDGLTLVEVVVALAIIAAGVMIAVLFQTSSIRTNTRADVAQKLTRLVSTELEYWRQTVVVIGEEEEGEGGPASLGGECVTRVPAGFQQEQCVVQVDVCRVTYGTPTTIDCSSGPAALFRITVSATDPVAGDTFSLSGYSTGLFVSGTIGGTQ